MKRVSRFETSDGKLHDTFLKAEKHADKRYGFAVIALAHKISRIEKCTDAVTFVEQYIDAFVELKALRDDLVLPTPEEGE